MNSAWLVNCPIFCAQTTDLIIWASIEVHNDIILTSDHQITIFWTVTTRIQLSYLSAIQQRSLVHEWVWWVKTVSIVALLSVCSLIQFKCKIMNNTVINVESMCSPLVEIFILVFSPLVMVFGIPGNYLILRVYWAKPAPLSWSWGLASADLVPCMFMVFRAASSCLFVDKLPLGYGSFHKLGGQLVTCTF